MKKPTVIVICGPTASGKTALSIELAKKKEFDIKNFLKRDGMIPELLSTNIDFIL